MKKSTIWFLTIIMALTFIGLLYVQIMYMNNMKKMRDDQFAEGVKRSLYAVSTRLEQDETKHFLEEDMATMDTQFIPRTNADGTVDMNYNFTTSDGTNYDLTLKGSVNKPRTNSSMREIMRGKYLYQKGLLDEVIFTRLLLFRSDTEP